MSILATFDSSAELKALFANRSDLTALEQSLGILLRQLHTALQVKDTESDDYSRYAGAIYKFFEGSQTSVEEFLKLWEVCNSVSKIIEHRSIDGRRNG